MIRTVIICTALVGFSAVGAVALSALHDLSSADIARTAPTAPVAPTAVAPAAKFVIPSYAVVIAPTAPVQLAALEAPSAEAAPLELTPIMTYADPDTPVPNVSGDLVAPAPKAPVQVAKRAPAAKPVKRTVRPMTAHIDTFRPSNRAKARPVIVAQAPAFTAGTAYEAGGPDYLIGVYR